MRKIEHRRVRNRMASLIALILLVPLPGWAQPLDSFERLALVVNLGDRVQVQEQSGAAYTGRLTRLTRRDMAIETPTGERRFTSEVVRVVAVHDHPLRRGALIGAVSFAVLGSVTICAREGGSGCVVAGAVGAAPIGAGLGLVIASLVPRMKPVYRAREEFGSTSAPDATTASTSLLEDLGLQVNLRDRLQVEDPSGNWTTGRLTGLTADELTIHTAAGDRYFTRAGLRQVAVRRRHLRSGTLIGAATGATYGALSECGDSVHGDCADGVIIGGALGAGGGVLVAALLARTTTVYPEHDQRTFVSPHVSRAGVAISVTRSW